MPDLPPSPNGATGAESGAESDAESITSTPRWVYVFGIIAIVLILLFVILHLSGRGLGGHALP